MVLSPHELAWLATFAGFTGDDVQIAVAVALAESGGDTNVMGRSKVGANLGQRDHGLWQISGRWHGKKLQTMGDWRDPRVNARMAHAVWIEAKGWTAWSTYNGTTPSYLAWMPDAAFGVAAPFPPPAPAAAPIDPLPTIAALRAQVYGLQQQLGSLRLAAVS